MTTWIFVFIAFFFGVGVVIALASVLRDLTSQRYNFVDRRLGLDADSADIADYYRLRNIHSGQIDSWFFRLVTESGVPMDVPTALLLIVGGGLVAAAGGWVITETSLAIALGILVGTLLPIAWLSIQRWRRLRAMRNTLPEALQIVADSVRTGHSLEQSSDMVTTELRGPIGDEFEQCASQLKLGNSPTSVMDQMTQRIPLPEFRVFATAVMVHQVAGGNLALLTERLSHAARQRQEFLGHVNAVTAGSRLSAIGLVIGSIVAVAALAWLEPEYINAFVTHAMGPLLLALALILQLIGIIWVWQLIRVSY